MSVLTEFATFITLNLANLATTYARLLAEHSHGYEAIPVNSRVTSGRKLLKAVSEACEMESSTPLCRLFTPKPFETEASRWPTHIVPPDPLQEVECLGQTLTPVVTNLEAGKFLWQLLADARAAIRLDSKPAGLAVPTSAALAPATQPDKSGNQPQITSTPLDQEHNIVRILLDTLPDHIYIKDARSRFLFVNDTVRRHLGAATLEAVVGKTDFDFSPPELAQQYYAAEQALLKSGQVLLNQEEPIFDHETGAKRWVLTTKVPFYDEQGQAAGLVGLNRDITDLKQAEEFLADRQLLQSLMDYSPDYIFFKDRKSRFIKTSKAHAQRLLGLADPQEAAGKTDFDLFPGQDAQRFYDEEQQIMTSGQPVLGREWPLSSPGAGGQTAWVSEHKLPLLDEMGQVVGLVGISRDITERKQIEEALAKRVKELNCLNEIGREMEEATPLPELLLWVSQRIPQAMQYPALSRVAITFEEQLYGLAEAVDLPAQITHGLYIKGKVLGRVYIAYTEKHNFLDEESAMLGAIATRLSGYIENQRLLRETEAALAETETLAREQTVLKELGQALTARLNVYEVLQEAYRQTSRLIDTTNFYIGLYDPANEEISFPLQVSESEIDMEITVIKASQGLAGYMVRNRVGLLFEDNVRARQEALGIKMVGEEAKSWLGVPMLIGDEVLGVMAVQSHTTPGLYQEHDRELLTAIANQVAIALQNARHFETTQSTLTEVRQSQELLQTIIDATPDWIFIKDREHRYRLVNQGYANSLHLTPADFIGRNDLELGFPEDIVMGNPEKGIRGFWADDREVMERGEIKLVEVEPAVVDGRPIFLRTVKVPLRDAAGEVWGVLGFVSDITEREQLLADLEKLTQIQVDLSQATTEEEMLTAIAANLDPGRPDRLILQYLETDAYDQPTVAETVAVWDSGAIRPADPDLHQRYPVQQFSLAKLWLAEPDEILIIADVSADPRLDDNLRALLTQLHIGSFTHLPLRSGNRWQGLIALDWSEPRSFNEREQLLYRWLLEPVAAVVARRRAFLAQTEALSIAENRLQETQVLQQLTQRLASTLELADIIQAFFWACEQLLGADYGVFSLVDRPAQRVGAVGGFNVSDDHLRRANHPLDSRDIMADIVRTGQTEIISGWDARFDAENFAAEGMGEWPLRIFSPITARQEHIGLVEVGFKEKADVSMQESQLRLLRTLVDQTAITLESSQRYQSSQKMAQRERVIREITEKMRAATSMEQLVKTTAEELGQRFAADYALVDLGLETN